MTAAPTPPIITTGAPLALEDVRELMESVQTVTAQLQETHATLQAQVTSLQQELADANARLRRSRSLAALGEMAAGIAHEIRNPLGSIQLYTQMLGDDLEDRPEQARVCGRIGDAVTRIDAIVKDVLSFARDVRIAPAPAETTVILDRAEEACAGVLESCGVSVRRAPVTPRAAAATCDVNLFLLALTNVMRNAAEAMAEADASPREIHLAVAHQRVRCPDGHREDRLVFTVDDTGPGVPEAVVARMFNPFFTTRPSGTGLGLPIVHRIVDAHGGHVLVGRSPGGGARFELCLPPEPISTDGPEASHPVDIDTTGVSLVDSVSRRIAMEATT